MLGENVSQAAQFAVSGSAQAGIFALSLALAPNFRERRQLRADPGIDASPAAPAHGPDAQGRRPARAFYAFLQGPRARAIFKRYGFLLPGESAP